MSMILPRGIVVNSEAIGGSIEQLDTQPVGEAEIARLWKGTSAKLYMQVGLN
jgi:hypothetical protein